MSHSTNVVDFTNTFGQDTIALIKRLNELKAEESALKLVVERILNTQRMNEAKRECTESRQMGQKRAEVETAMTTGRERKGMQKKTRQELVKRKNAVRAKEVLETKQKTKRNRNPAEMETTPEIVYEAIQCDSCRGAQRNCVWQSGTSTSCIPCRKAACYCKIGGMYTKSLKLHHPPQVPLGVTQAISVEAELTPTPPDQVYDILEYHKNIADCIEVILNDQDATVDLLFCLMERLRTILHIEQQTKSESAVSKEDDSNTVQRDMDIDK